jgi:hypothetical protein
MDSVSTEQGWSGSIRVRVKPQGRVKSSVDESKNGLLTVRYSKSERKIGEGKCGKKLRNLKLASEVPKLDRVEESRSQLTILRGIAIKIRLMWKGRTSRQIRAG